MSLYKASPVFEEIWDNIRLLLEWQQGFGFYLVFSDNTYASLELKQRINDYLHIQSKKMQWFRPEQPEDVPQQVLQTLLTPGNQQAPVWIELTAYPQDKLWIDIRQQTLSLLNRQRGLLEAQCLRAVFLQLPSAIAKDIVVYAPDLWSIRQYIAVLPSLEEESLLTLKKPSYKELVMEAEQADLAVQQGEWQKALDLSRSQLEKLRIALTKQPEHPQITFNLWVALMRLGSLEQKLKRYELAQQYYQEALAIAQRLYEQDYNLPQNIYCYTSSLSFIADLDYEQLNYSQALNFYQVSLILAKEWQKIAPNEAEVLNRLSFSLFGIARIHKKMANFTLSLQYGTELLSVALSLQNIINNNQTQRRLAMTFELLGDIKINLGDTEAGLKYYQESFQIIENILKSNPNNSQAIRDMIISLSKMGSAYEILTLIDKTEEYYQQALIMAKKQCEQIGNTPKALRDLLIVNQNLLDFKVKNKYDGNVISLSDEVIIIALQLYQLSKNSLQSINDLVDAYKSRLLVEQQLEHKLEKTKLLQKIADLEQKRQQLLESH